MNECRAEAPQDLDAEVDRLLLHFGEVVRRRRRALKLTQVALDRLLDIDASNLSNFEKGSRNMTLRNFLRLILTLDIAWEQLLAPRPPSLQQELITLALQAEPDMQELFVRLLRRGLGPPGPASSCQAQPLSSASLPS